MAPKSEAPTTEAATSSTSESQRKEGGDSKLSCFVDTHGVITTTMNDLPGYRIVAVLGTVYGITVRSRNIGVDLAAGLRSVFGGEVRLFTSLMYTSRNSAVERMVGECMGRGGNAIVAMRFDQGEVSALAQVCAYGTACIVEKIELEPSGKGIPVAFTT